MSVEAFVWPFERGEHSAFTMDETLKAFDGILFRWDIDRSVIALRFRAPADTCDIYCARDSTGEADVVRSLTIFRPSAHIELWRGALRLMSARPTVLFFSDDTTPLLKRASDVKHLPSDLLSELGAPVIISTAEEIVARRREESRSLGDTEG